jgi:DNA-binding NarL/FixJ family response regulator
MADARPTALRAVASVRLLIADGSSAERLGVRLALEDAGCDVCAEAATASEAIEAARRERPTVCLLDTELSGGALGAAAAISGDIPETAVVMFAPSSNDSDLFAALEAGARGYLTKDIAPERLATALRRIPHGEAPLPRQLVTKLITEFRARERRRRSPALSNLTGRELEVLELLAERLRTAEIAERLFVARGTVRTHIGSILKKLDVSSREAAIRIYEEG